MDLRPALVLNALFSFATGALLTIVPDSVGAWLGVEIDGWLRALGIGLLLHGVTLVWVAARVDAPRWAPLNIAMIAPYPLVMIGLVVTGTIPRDLGKVLAAADGVIVGAIALAQWRGLRNVSASAHPRPA